MSGSNPKPAISQWLHARLQNAVDVASVANVSQTSRYRHGRPLPRVRVRVVEAHGLATAAARVAEGRDERLLQLRILVTHISKRIRCSGSI